MQELEALNRNYIRSVAESDVAWFERHLSEDFLNSNPDGSIVDRAGFLQQIAKPFTLSDFDIEDVRIRQMGDFALIHAKTVYRKPDGNPGAGRYTDIWAKQGGRWMCVAAHVTRA